VTKIGILKIFSLYDLYYTRELLNSRGNIFSLGGPRSALAWPGPARPTTSGRARDFGRPQSGLTRPGPAQHITNGEKMLMEAIFE